MQELPDLKPNWFCDISLLSVNILPETSSKETSESFLALAYCFFEVRKNYIDFLFQSEGKLLFSKHDQKIIPSGLQINV